MTELDEQILTAPVTIGDIVEALESATVKLVILVDGQGAIIRTVSDGDIRRALLGGAALEDPDSWIPLVRDPVCVPAPSSDEAIRAARHDHPDVGAIVIIDEARRPIGLDVVAVGPPDILLSPPHLGSVELEYVGRAFSTNWVAPAGQNIDDFEAALADRCGRTDCVALSSGTAALHLALRVLGVSTGDRVYVSDLTFVASLQPILYQGGVPVLIDCEPQTWNMSSRALERCLQRDAADATLPAAIIVVHLYGQSADIDAICALADQYGVPVIEDAAESLGATYKGRPSGSHGVLGAYSFNGNKIITTAGGGALLSDDSALIERARYLATQGRGPAEHYQHEDVAYNYRMSNILAGIGIGQLEQLTARVDQRRVVYDRYVEGLAACAGIGFQAEVDGGRGNRWLTAIRLDPDLVRRHPYVLMTELRALGIESRPAWKPMSMQPLCRGFDVESHSSTQRAAPEIFLQSLCLPSGSSLSRVDQDRIIDAVREFIAEAS